MKTIRKNVFIKEDRFAATERGCSVDIRTHRHTILVDVTIDGVTTGAEMTLRQLALIFENQNETEKELQ